MPEAFTLLEDTIKEYVKDLDGDEYHPFIENFHQQFGNMAYRNQDMAKAKSSFEKVVGAKERLHGSKAKEVIGPLMQLQHMISGSGEVEESILTSTKAFDLLNHVMSEADNKLVMSSGSLTAKEKEKIEKEIAMYQKYKLDVIFNLHNLHRLAKKYDKALFYAKEHTKINLEIFKKEHKCYAYALMLEAQCMTHFPNLDHQETLKLINEALQIQLRIGQGKMVDPFLARIYEEKGHILRLLGGGVPAGDDGQKPQGEVPVYNDYNVRALRSFNSAYAIMTQSGEDQRQELLVKMIQELSQNPLISDQLKDGKFDTEYLTTKQVSDLEPSGNAESEALEKTEDDEGLDAVTITVCVSIAVIGVAGLIGYMKQR